MNRLILLLPCFFLLATVNYGQSSFDVSVAPGLGYFHGINRSGDEQNDRLLEYFQDVNQPSFNWRAGVHYNQQLSENLLVRTGLRWAALGYSTEDIELRSGVQHDGEGGFQLNPDQPYTLQLNYHYRHLEIPVLVRYRIGNDRLRFFLEAGVAMQYLAQSTTVQRLDGNRLVIENERDSMRTLLGSVQTGFGLEYQSSDRLQLFIQTNGHYQLSPQYVDTPIQYRLWQVGMELGARFLLSPKS